MKPAIASDRLSIVEAVDRLERRLAWYGLPLHRHLVSVTATEDSVGARVRDAGLGGWVFLVDRRDGSLRALRGSED